MDDIIAWTPDQLEEQDISLYKEMQCMVLDLEQWSVAEQAIECFHVTSRIQNGRHFVVQLRFNSESVCPSTYTKPPFSWIMRQMKQLSCVKPTLGKLERRAAAQQNGRRKVDYVIILTRYDVNENAL